MVVREKIPVIVGAVVAVLCQIILAPNIHISNAAPNFILAYVIALSCANIRGVNIITSFVLGLLYDLISTGPVGAMAFVCVAISILGFLLRRIFDNETHLVPIIIVILSSFVSEIVFGLLMMACGVNISVLDALVLRALPCGLYDSAIALLAYALAFRFAFRDKQTSEMKIIDTSVD